jgi:hypothetical protein
MLTRGLSWFPVNPSEARAAMNATIFETLLDSQGHGLGRSALSLFCECSCSSCDVRRDVTPENYLAKLASSGRYIVAAEHAAGSDEVLATHDGHALVERER